MPRYLVTVWKPGVLLPVLEAWQEARDPRQAACTVLRRRGQQQAPFVWVQAGSNDPIGTAYYEFKLPEKKEG